MDVAARFFILIEDPDLALRQVCRIVFCIDPPRLIGGLPAHCQGKSLWITNLVWRAVATKSCALSHFRYFEWRYWWRARGLNMSNTSSLSTELRACSRSRRADAVVIGDEVDLSSVDAHFGVRLRVLKEGSCVGRLSIGRQGGGVRLG